MLETKDKILSIIASIVVILSTIIGYINIEKSLMFFRIFVIIGGASFFISLLVILSRNYNLKYDYQLVQYLFHNDGRVQFNVIPKLILLFNKVDHRNLVEIEEVNLICNMTYENTSLISNFEWNIMGITNIGKHEMSEYYFMTTSDIGQVDEPNITLYENNRSNKYRVTNIKKSNDIYQLTWGIEHVLKRNDRMTHMKLQINATNSFDFSRDEIIFFYPPNYGVEIKYIRIELVADFEEEKFDVEMVEVGHIKGNKGIGERSIYRNPVIIEEGKKKYIYSISKKELNMKNLYYLRLIPKCKL